MGFQQEVCMTMNLEKIYRYALAREREGRDFFRSHAGRMSHAAAAGVFRTLAAEEEKHIVYVEGLLRGLAGTGGGGAGPSLEQDGLFAARAESELLEQSVIEAMIPDVAVLRTAYLIERDFAEFYEMAAAQAEGDARVALSALASWERGHEELFKRLHDRVFENYTQMPWGG
jgi:rubrerythrin